LPGGAEWKEARQRAAALFGLDVSEMMTGSNVVQLAEAIKAKVESAAEQAGLLPQRLLTAGAYLGLKEGDTKNAPRYRTAQAVAALMKSVSGREPTSRLQALAKAALETSAAAMGKSLSSAQAVVEALGRVFWEPLQAIGRLHDGRDEQGQAILTRLLEALKADELTTQLGPVLQESQQQAVRLLAPLSPVIPGPVVEPVAVPRPGPPGGTVGPMVVSGWKPVETGESDNLAADDLRRLMAELEQKLASGRRRRLKVSWTLLEEEVP
jgi:hypothetical protein